MVGVSVGVKWIFVWFFLLGLVVIGDLVFVWEFGDIVCQEYLVLGI